MRKLSLKTNESDIIIVFSVLCHVSGVYVRYSKISSSGHAALLIIFKFAIFLKFSW